MHALDPRTVAGDAGGWPFLVTMSPHARRPVHRSRAHRRDRHRRSTRSCWSCARAARRHRDRPHGRARLVGGDLPDPPELAIANESEKPPVDRRARRTGQGRDGGRDPREVNTFAVVDRELGVQTPAGSSGGASASTATASTATARGGHRQARHLPALRPRSGRCSRASAANTSWTPARTPLAPGRDGRRRPRRRDDRRAGLGRAPAHGPPGFAPAPGTFAATPLATTGRSGSCASPGP